MVIVSGPQRGSQTWSLEHAFTLRQRVRTTAAKLGITSSLSINMTTTGDAGTSDEDHDDEDPTRPAEVPEAHGQRGENRQNTLIGGCFGGQHSLGS
jgi:hypothetical protein